MHRDTGILDELRRRMDKYLVALLWALLLAAFALSPWYDRWSTTLWIGLPAAGIPTLLAWLLPGRLITRLTIAAATMVFAGLHIQLASGMTEMHFGVFVLLSLLLGYRDWRPILVAAGVIAVHHLAFNQLQAMGFAVYCMPEPDLGIVLLHALYVVVQTVALSLLAVRMERDARAAQEMATLSGRIGQTPGQFDLRVDDLTMQTPLGRAFMDTMSAVHASLSQVDVGIGVIDQAAHHIKEGNASLSMRTDAQSQALSDALAGMQALTDTARHNASHARDAGRLADTTSDIASQGGQVAERAVAAMDGIRASAHRIVDIVSVIDSIAFQTNILALNASVEAARASEQGRGFAVVATEVRLLAQRSAAAAKDIRVLIDESMTRVEDGSRSVAETGRSMTDIVAGVARVQALMHDIDVASDQQRQAMETVGADLEAAAQAARDNAELVQATASASEGLQQQTHDLADGIAHFVLCRQQAHAPAPRAVTAHPPSRAQPMRPVPALAG